MKKEIMNLLSEAKVKMDDENIEKIIEKLIEYGAESFEDLKYLKEKDIEDIFGLKKIQVAKVMEAIKKSNRREVKVELPKMPKDFSHIKLEVAGKTQLNIEDVINFIEFSALYKMGAEEIGNNVLALVERRLKELDEPANEKIIEIYKLVSKFKNFNSDAVSAFNFELSLLPKRHNVVKNVEGVIVPSVIKFINETLNFRMDLGDVRSLVLAKTLKTKRIPEDISTENLIIAAEDFAIEVNKAFAGLNKIIVKETLKLYKEAFNLINDEYIQELVGAKDSRDFMKKIGLDYSPKDSKTFETLKELIYQILIVLENDEIIGDSDRLYVYLQNVWNKGKTIDWDRFFKLCDSGNCQVPQRAKKSNKKIYPKQEMIDPYENDSEENFVSCCEI